MGEGKGKGKSYALRLGEGKGKGKSYALRLGQGKGNLTQNTKRPPLGNLTQNTNKTQTSPEKVFQKNKIQTKLKRS